MAYPYIVAFTEGQHNGKSAKNNWSADDIKNVVTQTQQFGAEKIPITLRHPKNDLPILGWFSKDTVKQGTYKGKAAIFIQPVDAAEGVFENLAQSTFNKVSVSIQKNGVINHLGVVENPGVKDLPSLGEYQFEADEDTESYESEFAFRTWFEDVIARRFEFIGNAFRSIRENMIATDGNTDNADKTFPKELIDNITNELPVLGDDLEWMLSKKIEEKLSPTPSQQFSEEATMTLEQVQAENATLKSQLSDLQGKFDAQQAKLEDDNLRSQFAAYVKEQSTTHKRIAPAQIPFYTTLLFDAAKASNMQFSAGDTDKVQAIKSHIESLPEQNYLFEDTASNGVNVTVGELTEADRKAIADFNKGGY